MCGVRDARSGYPRSNKVLLLFFLQPCGRRVKRKRQKRITYLKFNQRAVAAGRATTYIEPQRSEHNNYAYATQEGTVQCDQSITRSHRHHSSNNVLFDFVSALIESYTFQRVPQSTTPAELETFSAHIPVWSCWNHRQPS